MSECIGGKRGEKRSNLRLLRTSSILDQGNTCTARHGDCLGLCTYNTRTVPTNAHLHALLQASNSTWFLCKTLCLGRSMNMDLKKRRMRTARAAFAPVREATDQLEDQDLCDHLFDSKVFSALCYAAKTWKDIAATSGKILATRRALQR
ncbi:hypothetical protein RB195_021776 [Necator americanus]|uniref:Uncharacterized protein n=1 Tax=Necator americanus TaxID=51031 RepID=A0ABR1ECK6_NECAM